MRKVVVHRPGGYGRLVIEEAPDPVPGPGAALVRCAGMGVNYADCIVRMGLYASAKQFVGWPITPGFEFAGEVLAVGSGVESVTPGQTVCGVTRFGGNASHVAVPAAQLFPLPEGWDPIAAAGFPAVSLTAFYATHELAPLRPGLRVLVHSAAGGVGGALCQIAAAAGCAVVGVVGAGHKVEAARERGARDVIDKSVEKLWTTAERLAPEGFDVVFDANGPATLRQSYAHLAPAGKLVTYGFHSMFPRGRGRPNPLRLAWGWFRNPRFDPLDLTNANKSVLGFNLSYLFDRSELLQRGMSELGQLAAQGRLTPPRITTYPLEGVADAHRDLEGGRTVGKLVLVP